eukprot:946857-Pyramimonas_sp.AAC.1
MGRSDQQKKTCADLGPKCGRPDAARWSGTMVPAPNSRRAPASQAGPEAEAELAYLRHGDAEEHAEPG